MTNLTPPSSPIISIARSQTLGDVLRRTAQRLPQKTAVICGQTQWSYAQFDALVNRLAVGLFAMGIQTGDHVAMLARNSHGFAAMRFALARMGAVLIPINFMLKADEVAYILRHAQARVLVTDTELTPLAHAAAALNTQVSTFIWIPSEEETLPSPGMQNFHTMSAAEGVLPQTAFSSTDILQIVYTSGTESSPKGAMLTHDAVLWQYVSCVINAEIHADDLALHSLPLYHCAQLDVFFGPAVYVGSTNIITAKPTPENLLPLIERFGVTSFFAPPTVWIALLRSSLLDANKLRTLVKGYYGASIMPVEVLRELASRLPQVRLWNLYGQTEIAPLATLLGPEDQMRKLGSCGKAVIHVETRVVDDNMRDVQAGGEVGEIVHRSPHLMLGYYNDEERTRAAFESGWFHSGDLATIDEEGFITVVDRKKDMIKTGGENVASREVEEMIYRLSSVSEVAVIGLPDPKWVEAVTAVIVIKHGLDLTEEDVMKHCQQHMAGFKCPKRIIFTKELPKNPSGKLLKRELRQLYA
jgi:fatty-acyl-CoA synthase